MSPCQFLKDLILIRDIHFNWAHFSRTEPVKDIIRPIFLGDFWYNYVSTAHVQGAPFSRETHPHISPQMPQDVVFLHMYLVVQHSSLMKQPIKTSICPSFSFIFYIYSSTTTLKAQCLFARNSSQFFFSYFCNAQWGKHSGELEVSWGFWVKVPQNFYNFHLVF